MSRQSRTLKRTAGSIVALCVAGVTLAFSAPRMARVDQSLVTALETRFGRTEIGDWASIAGLVVAGGSSTRAAEAVRLARAHRHLKLVLTGPSEDEIMAALRADGIERERVLVEPFAINTYENAVRSKLLVAPRLGDRWLLVTSAYHMPRAIGAFYRAAFFVEPWPVDDGNSDLVVRARIAQHEWLGLIAYWLRGRTTTIFPGQEDLKASRLRG